MQVRILSPRPKFCKIEDGDEGFEFPPVNRCTLACIGTRSLMAECRPCFKKLRTLLVQW